MRLEKAMEIKLQWRKGRYQPPTADEMDADMISIEALEFFQKFQEVTGSHQDARLPSETEE